MGVAEFVFGRSCYEGAAESGRPRDSTPLDSRAGRLPERGVRTAVLRRDDYGPAQMAHAVTVTTASSGSYPTARHEVALAGAFDLSSEEDSPPPPVMYPPVGHVAIPVASPTPDARAKTKASGLVTGSLQIPIPHRIALTFPFVESK